MNYKNSKEYSWQDLLPYIGKLLRPYKARFIIATILRVSTDIAWLYPPFAFAIVVTVVSEGSIIESKDKLILVLSLWFIVMLWRAVGYFFAKKIGFEVAERAALDAKLESLKHMLKLDITWHEKESAGNRLKRIDRGSESIDDLARMWFIYLSEIAVNFIAITLIITTIDGMTGILLVIFTILYFTLSQYFLTKAKSAVSEVYKQEEGLNGIVYESINNVRSAKVMSMIPELIIRINGKMKSLIHKIKNRIFWFQFRWAILVVFEHVFRIGMVVFIVIGIAKGNYEIGFLVLFYSFFNRISKSILDLSNVVQDLAVIKIALGRVKDILGTPITIDSDSGKSVYPKKWKSLNINNVSFAYDSVSVLKKISLKIKRGEKIGIVGPSGGGKSTLFKLLLKEHEQFNGSIAFDDTKITDIKKSNYFEHVAVVLQDTEVFNFSIHDNITITNPKQKNNTKLLDNAIRISHVKEFVRKLPNGVNTVIGEKGIKLSGGEKQRVGIARAVYKEPDIFLLDEATSHLDIESEQKIQDSLHKFFQSVTAVVIAHRLSTIKEMDRIIVLEDGQIKEEGSFDELYKKKGRFYDLWNKQKL